MAQSDFGRVLDGMDPLCRKEHPRSDLGTGESCQIAYYAEALGISYYEAQCRVTHQRNILMLPREGEIR